MDRIFEEVSSELKVKKGTVKNVYKHIFWSVAETMKKGEYQHILLNGFGKFVVRPARKKTVDAIKARNPKYGITNNSDNTEESKEVSNMDVLA